MVDMAEHMVKMNCPKLEENNICFGGKVDGDREL